MGVTVITIAVVFLLIGAFGWWLYKWQYSKADEILENWSKENGLTVIKKERANIDGTGPGVRYAGNTQVIYRIEAKDVDGNIRTGVAHIGSENTGTLSDQIDVVWEN